MLGFQFLLLDLIFSNRILVTEDIYGQGHDDKIPRIAINGAQTANVYGRRSGRRTIYMPQPTHYIA